MVDNTPIPELLFQMEMSLCEQFPAFTPLTLRKEKARDVFVLIRRFTKYAKKKTKNTTKDGKRIIRRPASDTWW